MINYGRVRGTNSPSPIEITPSAVYVANNIVEYTEIIDNITITGYEYDYIGYTKDEYLLMIAEKNKELEDELIATKILLGVEE